MAINIISDCDKQGSVAKGTGGVYWLGRRLINHDYPCVVPYPGQQVDDDICHRKASTKGMQSSTSTHSVRLASSPVFLVSLRATLKTRGRLGTRLV